MIIRIKVKQQQPCTFRASCQGACEWCNTNQYTEACVPLLQAAVADRNKTIKDSDEIIKKLERRLAQVSGRLCCATCRHNGLDYVKAECHECKEYSKWEER